VDRRPLHASHQRSWIHLGSMAHLRANPQPGAIARSGFFRSARARKNSVRQVFLAPWNSCRRYLPFTKKRPARSFSTAVLLSQVLPTRAKQKRVFLDCSCATKRREDRSRSRASGRKNGERIPDSSGQGNTRLESRYSLGSEFKILGGD